MREVAVSPTDPTMPELCNLAKTAAPQRAVRDLPNFLASSKVKDGRFGEVRMEALAGDNSPSA